MFAAYDPSVFQSLLDVRPASDSLDTRQSWDLYETDLRSPFIAHGVHNKFSMVLLHRHFDLSEDEMLVKVGSVATPWTKEAVEEFETQGLGHVIPTSWLVRDGKYYPYEFSHAQKDGPDMSSYQEFLADFAAVLTRAGLSDLLGLALVEGGDLDAGPLIEMTQGRSNITFVRPQSFEMVPGKYVPAMWFMTPEGMKQGLGCVKSVSGHKGGQFCYH